MKTKTHNLFNIGVLTAIGYLFTTPASSFISAGILSIIGNTLIDSLGHKKKKVYLPAYDNKNRSGLFNFGRKNKQNKEVVIPVRTYKTHSLLRGTIWGLLPAIVLSFAVPYLPKDKYIILNGFPYWILIQGIFVGPLHLFLDLPTEEGIFVKKNGRFNRFALAHIKYNDLFWNTVFQLIGIAFVILTFYKFTGGFHGFNYR